MPRELGYPSGMSIGFCIHHPDRPATARCHSCHKPVCADCVVQNGANTFCSSTCRDNYVRFYGRYTPESRPGCLNKLKNLLVTLIALTILAGVAVLVGALWLHIGFCQGLLQALLKRVGF
jgi:hypothetical protein